MYKNAIALVLCSVLQALLISAYENNVCSMGVDNGNVCCYELGYNSCNTTSNCVLSSTQYISTKAKENSVNINNIPFQQVCINNICKIATLHTDCITFDPDLSIPNCVDDDPCGGLYKPNMLGPALAPVFAPAPAPAPVFIPASAPLPVFVPADSPEDSHAQILADELAPAPALAPGPTYFPNRIVTLIAPDLPSCAYIKSTYFTIVYLISASVCIYYMHMY